MILHVADSSCVFVNGLDQSANIKEAYRWFIVGSRAT